MANIWVLAFVVACALISMIPQRSAWFGIPNATVQLSLIVAGTILLDRLRKRYVAAIAAYEPQTPLQAKRANEQIKLTATFGNTVAAACVAVAFLGRIVTDPNAQPYNLITALIWAGLIHITAREIVGQIKDETPQPEGE